MTSIYNKGVKRPLEGKVALVTGAGIRLGRAIALGLGRLGANVAVHHHGSAEGAAEVVAAIGVDGNKSKAFRADLSKKPEIDALVEAVEKDLGPISVLINSAAIYQRADFTETPEALLDSLWALNAKGAYLVAQAVARRMRPRGEADIVNICDVEGTAHAWRHYSAYGMTKAALAHLTKSLALELAPAIRVNGVAPGTVLPPTSMSPDQLSVLRERIPQRRFGSPDDIVETVAFLLTGPRFITGQIIAVDGGRSIESL